MRQTVILLVVSFIDLSMSWCCGPWWACTCNLSPLRALPWYHDVTYLTGTRKRRVFEQPLPSPRLRLRKRMLKRTNKRKRKIEVTICYSILTHQVCVSVCVVCVVWVCGCYVGVCVLCGCVCVVWVCVCCVGVCGNQGERKPSTTCILFSITLSNHHLVTLQTYFVRKTQLINWRITVHNIMAGSLPFSVYLIGMDVQFSTWSAT